MKAVRSSSHVSIVSSLSSFNHVFASLVSDRGNIIRRTASYSVCLYLNITDSEEFVNVFMRISFGSTIELVSFDESQVVTFNGKFICGFKNSDCRIRSWSNNTVGSPHRQLSGVEVDHFFDRRELFCFVDEVFDSEYVQVQLMLLVYKLLLSVFRVNVAITKLQLLKRLGLLKDFLLSEKG
ncbi:hypothetical protein Tco_0896984 [Tanacetum coccineum]